MHVIKMFVKLKLFVICVVLIKLCESNNCDNVLKCVTDGVSDTLNRDLNANVESIETSAIKSVDDNLLKKLSQVLVENFSNLFKQGPLIKLADNKTKIYVQTFKINDSITETATKLDLTGVYSAINVDNQMFNGKPYDLSNGLIDTTVAAENSTSYYSTKDNSTTISTAENTDIKEHTEKSNIDYIELQNKPNDIIGKTDTESMTTIAYFEDNIRSKVIITNNNGVMGNNTANEIDSAFEFLSGQNEIDVGELTSDNLTDYLDVDYIEIYKDTTNEDVEYTPAIYIPTTTGPAIIITDQRSEDNINSVYPWIAAVFVMNNDNKQFEYICDGSLMSERVVLTAARCVMKSNATVDVANILVILGKRSLQNMGSHETVLRVKSINIHENFTAAEGKVSNDMAILVLAEHVTFNEDIQPAPLGAEDKPEPLVIATTGWHVSGPIQPLYLKPQPAEDCLKKTGSENIVCSTLGHNESTCPSFGGLLVGRQEDNQWRLKGISIGDPMTKGLCFNKDLAFTKIGNYLEWITKNLKNATSN